MATPVLVFVPGTIGSELADDQGLVWPGSFLEAITKFDQAKFARLLAPGLKPRDIIRSAAGGFVPIYQPWIDAFQGIVDGHNVPLFHEHPPAGSPKTLRPFPHDWRLDLQVTAGVLADFLDDTLMSVPDADIKLVCHSQGGMLARFYLESGRFDARPAFAKISLLATFGTPHNGAPIAYAGAVGLYKTEFLTIAQTQALANDNRYPSLYQLFPSSTHSFIWDVQHAATSLAADDTRLVDTFALSKSSLQSWRDFRAGLTGRRPAHIRYFYVIGSRQQTLVRLTWDGGAKTLEEEQLDDAGDGTVPLLGSMDLATQSEFVGKSHVSLIDTRQARGTFAALLGAQTRFAAGPEFSLSVRRLSVTTSEAIQVQIEFRDTPSRVKAVLRFQRADIPDPAAPIQNPAFLNVAATPVIPIDLTSVGLEFLNLKTPPIPTRGLYRPVLLPESGGQIIGPQFVVEEP